MRRLRALHRLVPRGHRHHRGGRRHPRRLPGGPLTLATIDAVIAKSPVLAGLPGRVLSAVAGCGRTGGLGAGAFLAREGTPAETFHLIRSGRVAIEVHAPGRAPLVVETVEAGSVVGWSWLFPPYRWAFDVRAVEPTRTIDFDGACLRGKCEEDHELGYRLMERFAQVMLERLQATRLRLLDLYGDGRRG